jgi:allophanate hydrolase subunit 2
MNPQLEVIEAGPLTTVQDAGRFGLAHLGVPPSGFLDAPAARLANRLVGNDDSDALLETTCSGPCLRVQAKPPVAATLVAAVTGAPAPVWINGRRVNQNAALLLRDGTPYRSVPPSPALAATWPFGAACGPLWCWAAARRTY